MGIKSTKIVIQFKELPMNLYFDQDQVNHPNLLIIHIQPDEGITLRLNGNKLDYTGGTVPVQLYYSNNSNGSVNTPEAYERLLYDCILGDTTNFAHWDELNLSWKFIDAISNYWANNLPGSFPNYEAGTMGPKTSDELLKKDGFQWWSLLSDNVN